MAFDRRLILAIVVFAGMFLALTFDPLNLKDKFASEEVTGKTAATTGLFVASDVYATILPGVLFLILVSLFYFLSKQEKS